MTLVVPPAKSFSDFFRNPHQSQVGANPQIARVVFDDVTDAVAGEAVRGGVARPFSILQPRQAVAGGADPQNAVRFRVKAGNVIAGQTAVVGSIGSEFSVLEKIQAAVFRADPKISAGVFRDGADDVFRKAVARREQFPVLAVEIARGRFAFRPKAVRRGLQTARKLSAQELPRRGREQNDWFEIQTALRPAFRPKPVAG